jgi:5'-3' exonuclease
MVEFEADDALAAGAALASADPRVEQVLICTPDKDLAQCVGGKVFQWDRRKDLLFDSEGVRNKYGVSPSSIPDYLALVGDSADGFPGLKGWGQKSSATLLDRYGSLELIPDESEEWDVTVRSSGALAATLAEHREEAMLFKKLATVRLDAPVAKSVTALEWQRPGPNFEKFCVDNRMDGLVSRTQKLVTDRA